MPMKILTRVNRIFFITYYIIYFLMLFILFILFILPVEGPVHRCLTANCPQLLQLLERLALVPRVVFDFNFISSNTPSLGYFTDWLVRPVP